jgi:hypothetical protein
MRKHRERVVLGLLLVALPAVAVLAVVVPASRRLAALHRRIEAAHLDTPEVPSFVPVGKEERAFLENPDAPWRTRIPVVADDAARLTEVDRVVSEVSAALAGQGLRAAEVRLLLDPIQADFSLPGAPLGTAARPGATTDRPDLQMAAWALEVSVPGSTRDLFRVLAAVSGVRALVEPGGLRWETSPPAEGPTAREARPGPRQAHRQVLVLRTFYLRPGS